LANKARRFRLAGRKYEGRSGRFKPLRPAHGQMKPG
jgi:hypothetical protein